MKKFLSFIAIILIVNSQFLNSAQLLKSTSKVAIYPQIAPILSSSNELFSSNKTENWLQPFAPTKKSLTAVDISSSITTAPNPNAHCPIGFCANFILNKISSGSGTSAQAGDSYWYSCAPCNNTSSITLSIPNSPGIYQGVYNASGQYFTSNTAMTMPVKNGPCTFANLPGTWLLNPPSDQVPWGIIYECPINIIMPQNLPDPINNNAGCPTDKCCNFIWNGQYNNPTWYTSCGNCDNTVQSSTTALPSPGVDGYYQAGYNASGQKLNYTAYSYSEQDGVLSENGVCTWINWPGLWKQSQPVSSSNNGENLFCEVQFQQSTFQTCTIDSDCPGWGASCAFSTLSSGCPFSCSNNVCVQTKSYSPTSTPD